MDYSHNHRSIPCRIGNGVDYMIKDEQFATIVRYWLLTSIAFLIGYLVGGWVYSW